MKKILLFSAVACMAFYACKKDDKPATPDPVNEIDPANREELSSSIKVGYGAVEKGELPAASGVAGAPVLENGQYENISVISGRYVVINTTLADGTVAGYYLAINGAGEYFKIDYTKERNLRKPARNHASLRETNFRDSVIVIKLPENLKSDTFSITYAAYDTLNQVSNHLRSVINILPTSNDETNKPLIGTWKYERAKEGDTWDDSYYHKDTSYNTYGCKDGKLTYCPGYDTCNTYMDYISEYLVWDLEFASKNIMKEIYEDKFTLLDLETSTCENHVFKTINDNYTGFSSYTYDPARQMITTVYDDNGGNDEGVMEVIKMKVVELSATKLLIEDPENPGYQVEFSKK